jgi:23S rRNA pseudouridine1911/1915/1917 synthase
LETENKEYIVPEGTRKTRADKLLSGAFDEHSRSDFERAFEAELVLVKGQPIVKNRKLSFGDVVTFSMPKVEKCDMTPVDLNLSIIFEDEHLLVIDKVSGLITHPGAGAPETTLAHGLLFHCQGQLSGIGGVERPGIVHRLDRDTSGLIVAAKTDVAHRGLSELFQTRTLIKEYSALVAGHPELKSGSIRKPIERNPMHRHKMRICQEGYGREAHTDWRMEHLYQGGYALLRCRIHSGRTHQIRVHMKSLKHSILGDIVYGFREMPLLPAVPDRVLLHSARLAFTHPITEEELDLEAPLPEAFQPFVNPRLEVD